MAMHTSGLERLLGALDALCDRQLLDAAAQGLEEGLTAVAEEARMLCPKDTGALAESIAARVNKDGGQLSGEVFAGREYAVYVEMGTQAQPARPFLYPAFKAKQQSIVQRVAGAAGAAYGRSETTV